MAVQLDDFFAQLMGIVAPFSIGQVEQSEDGSVQIRIEVDPDYRPSRFHTIHKYQDKSWRHLNVMQHEGYLHCRVPYFKDKRTAKTRLLDLPWARPGSGFTLLLEQVLLGQLRQTACRTTVAHMHGLYPQRITTLYDPYTLNAFEFWEAELAKKVGVDETSSKKGHEYITLF